MKQITKDLNLLKEEDIISILLYGIYKLTDDPNYSSISELIYALDKDNLFKLCSTFGGCTIRIPTLQELKNLTNTLIIYQDVNFKGVSFVQACEEHQIDSVGRKEVYTLYNILSKILEDYPNE